MKKYAPYILILIVLVGLFGLAGKVSAQAMNGVCQYIVADTFHKIGDPALLSDGTPLTQQQCGLNSNMGWFPTGATNPSNPLTAYQQCLNNNGTTASCANLSGAPSAVGQSEFEKVITANLCGFAGLRGTVFPGCFIEISYGLFYVIPAFLLWAAAQLFNVMIYITLGSKLLAGSTFISAGWMIVRDLSNIFFILILLYIAIKIILDLGGHDVKKMITKVIILALLINFSMFFTEVVIDTSNILALVFYNKLQVNQKDPITGQSVPITYTPALAAAFGAKKMFRAL